MILIESSLNSSVAYLENLRTLSFIDTNDYKFKSKAISPDAIIIAKLCHEMSMMELIEISVSITYRSIKANELWG